MKFSIWVTLACLMIFSLTYSKQVSINLYGRSMTFEIGNDMTLTKKFSLNENGLRDFYFNCKKGNYKAVESVLGIKQELKLDDWYILRIIDEINQKANVNNCTFFKWFMLGGMGYKVQMSFFNKKDFLLIESNQALINIIRKGKYYCLNCDSDLKAQTFYFTNFNPFRGNTSVFTFGLTTVDAFEEDSPFRGCTLKSYKINDSIRAEIKFSNDIINLLCDFPDYNMLMTFNAPFSGGSNELIKAFKKHVSHLSDSSKANYIMKFISLNSVYSSDQDIFGKDDKWMTPEQFLFYRKGDCEDISAFLFYVLKQIINKPMLILSYPKLEHINIAISLDIDSEADLIYKSHKYFICEATVDSGFIPIGKYKTNKSVEFNVIGEYVP